MASNSLLEALVFAARLEEYAKENLGKYKKKQKSIKKVKIDKNKNVPLNKEAQFTQSAKEWILVEHNLLEIQTIMWDYVGIVRSDLRLIRALNRISLLQKEIEEHLYKAAMQNKILEIRNLALVARLIIQSSLLRKENCALYYNTDRLVIKNYSQVYSDRYTILEKTS